MNYFIEKHIEGYCVVEKSSGMTLIEGTPHNYTTKYWAKKKDAQALVDELNRILEGVER